MMMSLDGEDEGTEMIGNERAGTREAEGAGYEKEVGGTGSRVGRG